MEDREFAEVLQDRLTKMPKEGTVYQWGGQKTQYWIRWHSLEVDWFVLVTVGSRGGLAGYLYVLDQRQSVLADQLRGCCSFDIQRDIPFEAIGRKAGSTPLGLSQGLHAWIAAQPKKGVEAAQEFAVEYLERVYKFFLAAESDAVQSELVLLERMPGSDQPPNIVPGGAPGLGRKK